MSCFWMGLSLLIVLQHSVSSDEYVKLNCTAESGHSVIINCTIQRTMDTTKGAGFTWSDANGTNLCNLTDYSCDWDAKTYVSMEMSKVERDENITVEVWFSEGMAKSTINVHGEEPQPPRPEPLHTSPGGTLVSLIVIGVVAPAIILAILYYLVKTKQTQKSLLQGSQSLNEQEAQQSILEG